MKKIMIALFCFCLLPVALSGCNKYMNTAPESGADTPPTTTVEATPSSSPEAAVENKDYETIGSKLKVEESDYILKNDLSDKNAIELFGMPENKSEEIVWGADGLKHQTWSYIEKGLELGMVRNEKNAQFVVSIAMSSPCDLKTSRGIGIGSSKEDVIKVYGDEVNPEKVDLGAESVVAGTVYGGLVFNFEGERVAQIFIGAAAE